MTCTLPSRQPDAGGRLRAYRARPIWGERSGVDTISADGTRATLRHLWKAVCLWMITRFFPPLSMLGIIYFHIIVPQTRAMIKHVRYFWQI